MSASEPARVRPEPGRTPKARRTRAHLLEVSLALFQEKGFDETSMRDIAARAGLSLGATYYHFRSKEELVFAFYARTQREAEAEARAAIAETSSFADRLRALLGLRLDHIAAYRGFLSVLARNALDPEDPLSPFGPGSREIREAAIATMAETVEGSDLRVHEALRPRLPVLLWLLQMAILFLWVHDGSEGQRRTRRVLELSVTLLTGLFALTAAPIPGLGGIIEQVAALIDEVATIGIESFGEAPSGAAP